MNKQRLNSIWASIDAQRDAVGEAKFSEEKRKPVIAIFPKECGGHTAVSVKVNNGDGKLRCCSEVLKPQNGEAIDHYIPRLQKYLGINEVVIINP